MADPELSAAMTGAWRLACLDRAGLRWFDDTTAGLVRSFRAGIYAFPGYLLLKWFDAPTGADADALRFLVASSIGYVVIWVSYPLILLSVARWLGREPFWPRHVTVYNWIQIPETLLLVAASIIVMIPGLPRDALIGLLLTCQIAVLLYEWFVAKVALEIDGPQATIVVLIGFIIPVAVSRLVEWLST